MNASDLLVKCLEAEGVEYIFGIPGEENIHFLNALNQSSIRFITTADERGAAFMAAGYGRLTGKPGVVATTIGPGALNILNGLAYAQLGGFPLIALTWQNGLRANKKSNNYQYVDVASVFRPVVKWQKTIAAPEQIPSVIRSGFKTSSQPKNGAVHIEIPADVSEENVSDELSPFLAGYTAPSTVDEYALKAVIHHLQKASSPVIIAGVRANQNNISEALERFTTDKHIPIISTPMAQGIVSSSNPYSLYSFSSQMKSLVHEVIPQADTIITVGMDSLEYNPGLWNPDNSTFIISIDTCNASICENYNPQLELVGDIATTISALNRRLILSEDYDNKLFLQLRKDLSESRRISTAFPLKPSSIVETLRNSVGDAMVVHDNGMYKLWMSHLFRPDNINQIIIDNCLASMGSGIPQAIAAKLAFPERNVIATIGDGGFLMSLGELSTIAALKLPITIIIWRDDEYGMIKWHQRKNNLPAVAVSLTNPDYVQLAESFGGKGYKVTQASQLGKVLSDAFKSKTFTIIDCPVDYSEEMEFIPEKKYDNTTYSIQ